jgi:hypothetical protein
VLLDGRLVFSNTMSASTDPSHPWKSLVRARAPAPCLNWSLYWAWLSKGFRCPAAIVSILRGTGWLEPDRLPVQLLLVGLMFVSLLMSVAIAEAFGGRAWLFVAAVFLIVALRGRALGEHFVDVLVWELIAGGWPVGCWCDR